MANLTILLTHLCAGVTEDAELGKALLFSYSCQTLTLNHSSSVQKD